MELSLSTPVASLARLTKAQRAALQALELRTARDLLFHFPFRYDDFSVKVSLAQLEPGADASFTAQVMKIASRRAFRRRMNLTEALLSDGTDSVRAVWFNQPYLTKYLRVGETYRFAGKLSKTKYGPRLQNPIYEPAAAMSGAVNPFLPVYPATAGLSQFVLRKLIWLCLPLTTEISDHLPEKILREYKLSPLAPALRSVHVPESVSEYTAARRRLAFDELLRLQLSMGRVRRHRAGKKAPAIPFAEDEVQKFVRSLPFVLTNDQRRAAWEIIRDMEHGTPMNRLLDGDVGSGKTAVAAIAALNVAAAGYQTAIMAPTEILALQHYHTLGAMFGRRGPKVVLWTNAYRRSWSAGRDTEHRGKVALARLAKQVSVGRARVVVGTQALIERGVKFAALALAVIDEQHRFGVRTRQLLCTKSDAAGEEPHLLSMTATPIPRSLALTVYGDLSLSLLKEKPGGRQRIITRLVAPRERASAYEAIRKELVAGRQTFVVCPLIDKSDVLEVTAVSDEFERLRTEIFPEFAVAMLHGRQSATEKEKTIREFKDGKTQVLVSTSVIEVGVDVPNATVMCIEGADRFGLAQLHQFRGRVGRGEHQSYCYLFPTTFGEAVRERLEALVKIDDGFVLAEKDLRLRGPGDVLGDEQSGYFSALRLATAADVDLIRDAREVAETILDDDPEITKQPALRAFVGETIQEVHLE